MSDDDVTSSETSITSPSRTRLQPADESSSYDSVHHACTVKSPLIGSAVPEIADNIVPSRAKAYSKDFWILWLGILVLATAISLDVQTVPQFQSYALSTLHGSAWLASFSGIANFVNATARPPIARLSARYGNFRLFLSLVLILVVGFMLSAASHSIGAFALGQCLTALGQVGVQFSQNIIVAQNSALPNRALATALPMSPFAFTVFAVAPISEALLPDRWRLGYALWALMVPLASLPLLIHLWSTERYHELCSSGHDKPTITEEFDMTGLVLFATSLSLIFFSTTPPSSHITYILQSPALALGTILLLTFIYQQVFLAPIPILALRHLSDRTILAGCTTTFLYFLSFSIYQPFLYPYFVISEDLSISSATNASLIFMFSSTTFGLLASLALKYTQRFKWLATSGTIVRTLGSMAMLYFCHPTTGKWQTYSYQAFAGAGMGMGSWVIQVGVQAAVSRADTGAILALYATFGSLGGFLGDAFSSVVFTPSLTQHLREKFPDTSDLPGDYTREQWIRAIKESVLVATSFERGSAQRDAIDQSWAASMRLLHSWSLCALLLACVVVWGMRNLKLEVVDGDTNARRGQHEIDGDDESGGAAKHQEQAPLLG